MGKDKTSKLFVYTAQHSMQSNRAVFTVQEREVIDKGEVYVRPNDPNGSIFSLVETIAVPKKTVPFFCSTSESGNSFLYYVSETRDDAAARERIEKEVNKAQIRIKEEYLRAKEEYESAQIVFPPILGAVQKDPQNMSPMTEDGSNG